MRFAGLLSCALSCAYRARRRGLGFSGTTALRCTASIPASSSHPDAPCCRALPQQKSPPLPATSCPHYRSGGHGGRERRREQQRPDQSPQPVRVSVRTHSNADGVRMGGLNREVGFGFLEERGPSYLERWKSPANRASWNRLVGKRGWAKWVKVAKMGILFRLLLGAPRNLRLVRFRFGNEVQQ
jgi:hypothetical protein